MFFQHRALSVAKDARRPDENQDASEVDEDRGIAAISDGASSSLFAARWAHLLVEGVVSDPQNVRDSAALAGWLQQRRAMWTSQIDTNALAWHQKPKLADGAFATLLWVELRDAESGGGFELVVHAVGDCCLFHVRDGQVLRVFPIESSDRFGVDPALVGSSHRQSADSLKFETMEDTCRENDLLVLSTDAVAAWALAEMEAGSPPDWESMWRATPQQFGSLIDQLREAQRIRYDDSTVLLLRVCGSLPTPLGPPDTVSQRLSRWVGRIRSNI